MHLTRALNYYRHFKHVPGQLYSGKNKLIPKIKVEHKERALKRYLLQEANLDILSKPYLTAAEEDGHMEALGYTKEAQRKQESWEGTKARWEKPISRRIHYLEEHLKHLNIRKAWE